MQTFLTELLCTLETLTAEAARECRSNMCLALALTESRQLAIARLARFIQDSNCVAPAELDRMRNIQCGGADLLLRLRERQGELRQGLCAGARQRAFAECVTGVLNIPEPSQSFDL